ncbi:cysteine dioxygenase [Ideonella sp. A 288]|uniref:cysteine dioxygenase family protein n=1 Tax=Ideonella sp. A 288 TaxID=1962181 RepID=UPI000B4AE788|nr:cysteine dioxygenase [Ideonella sp. A 288]
MHDRITPLREFVTAMTALVSSTSDERRLLSKGRQHLARLIASDRWLPEAFATPRADRYAQYLLHCDLQERFSVVSFVWGPGQRTPVHNHTVWGLVGVLRGAERCDEYTLRDGLPVAKGIHHVMKPGDIDEVSPTVGDWHRVSSALDDGVSVSVHVYGGNIGAVHRRRLDDHGVLHDFVSGYDSAMVPNLWDRSAATRSL